MVWRQITGMNPPTTPPTAEEYTHVGLPWFTWYDDQLTALEGSDTLARLKSVAALGKEKKNVPLPENQSVSPTHVVKLSRRPAANQVRELAGRPQQPGAPAQDGYTWRRAADERR